MLKFEKDEKKGVTPKGLWVVYCVSSKKYKVDVCS